MKKLLLLVTFASAPARAMHDARSLLNMLNHPATYTTAAFALGACGGALAHKWYYASSANSAKFRVKGQKKLVKLSDATRTELATEEKVLHGCKNPLFHFFLTEDDEEMELITFSTLLEQNGFKDDRKLMKWFEDIKNLNALRKQIIDTRLATVVDVGRYLNAPKSSRRRIPTRSHYEAGIQKENSNTDSKL